MTHDEAVASLVRKGVIRQNPNVRVGGYVFVKGKETANTVAGAIYRERNGHGS